MCHPVNAVRTEADEMTETRTFPPVADAGRQGKHHHSNFENMEHLKVALEKEDQDVMRTKIPYKSDSK